jgi:hypothetical protein
LVCCRAVSYRIGEVHRLEGACSCIRFQRPCLRALAQGRIHISAFPKQSSAPSDRSWGTELLDIQHLGPRRRIALHREWQSHRVYAPLLYNQRVELSATQIVQFAGMQNCRTVAGAGNLREVLERPLWLIDVVEHSWNLVVRLVPSFAVRRRPPVWGTGGREFKSPRSDQ